MVCMFVGEGRGWWRDLVERCVGGACALRGVFSRRIFNERKLEELGGLSWVKRVSSRIVFPCL